MNRLPAQKDISEVLKKYSELKIISRNPFIIAGFIDIEEPNGDFWGKYKVEIKFSKEFPYRFPKMFEVEGKIPREADWHVYTDGSCCTTVYQNEILSSRKGITLLRFLDQFAVPYLANHKHKELKGKYASGEYSHGLIGYKEFFEERFANKDPQIILRGLRILLKEESLSPDGICFCGSGKKFRHCHLTSIRELKCLPKVEISLLRHILKKNWLQINQL